MRHPTLRLHWDIDTLGIEIHGIGTSKAMASRKAGDAQRGHTMLDEGRGMWSSWQGGQMDAPFPHSHPLGFSFPSTVPLSFRFSPTVSPFHSPAATSSRRPSPDSDLRTSGPVPGQKLTLQTSARSRPSDGPRPPTTCRPL